MNRNGRLVGVLVATVAASLATAAAAPASARASTACPEAECGVPACYDTDVRVRPGMARALRVYCWRATGARLVTPPAHGVVSDVSGDWSGLKFTMRADDGAPRQDEAVFEVTGHEGSIEVRVAFEVIPTSENSAPVCRGDSISKRSDGTGPVDVFMHPWCYDPDEDEFVMHGGGPGTHPEAPKSVPAGESEANWGYRTATYSGREIATVHAVDVLGARSADAELDVTVGPGVDRLPECRPNPSGWSPSGVTPVHSRPGATRRFGMICEDADADPFAPRVSDPPDRGAMTLFDVGDLQHGYWGVERWIDAVYVPADRTLEPDEFAVTATGTSGDGPHARMAIVPRELPDNGGGGCGWSGSEVVMNTPGTVTVTCSDDDGDELSAQVAGAPAHGTAGPAAVTPARYGGSTITVPYVPEPGYTGYDCIKVVVSDGHGLEFQMLVDINVVAPVTVSPPWVPPPVPEVLPPVPQLPDTPLTATQREAIARAAASEALGTDAVTRVPAAAGEVWTAARLSKRRLLRRGRAPAVFVFCPRGCGVRSSTVLDTGWRPRGRASRRRAALALAAGQGRVLALTVDRAQRRPLLRAQRARGRFTIAFDGAPASKAIRRSIPIGR